MKNAIRIWVKGDREQGRDAITQHLPRATEVEFVQNSLVTGDTIWDVGNASRSDIVVWFCEPPMVGPYPVGSLLYYSEGK